MAVSLNGVEPVEIKGRKCTPIINTELKMRLREVKRLTPETDRVLASAFPNDEDYVLSFLINDAPMMEKEILLAYLVGGEQMVDTVMSELKDRMRRAGEGINDEGMSDE